MTEQQKNGLLKLASEQVPCGIYAIRKGKDYYELRNEPMSVTQMKRARRGYKRSGVKVYCNGL